MGAIPALSITAASITDLESLSYLKGFTTDFNSRQRFNGLSQQGGTFAHVGDGLMGIGLVILSDSGTLKTGSGCTGTLYLHRDNDSSNGALIVTNTGSITPSNFTIEAVSATSLRVRLTDFSLTRNTGGGITGTETISLSGTVEFTNIPSN